MPISAVDHVEAALERLTSEDIAALSPARRARLRATLTMWECLCHEKVQSEPKPPRLYVTGDAQERLQREQTSGVLADLRDGRMPE
jgi:hypothetical protein